MFIPVKHGRQAHQRSAYTLVSQGLINMDAEAKAGESAG
jgi:hypothetical protein